MQILCHGFQTPLAASGMDGISCVLTDWQSREACQGRRPPSVRPLQVSDVLTDWQSQETCQGDKPSPLQVSDADLCHGCETPLARFRHGADFLCLCPLVVLRGLSMDTFTLPMVLRQPFPVARVASSRDISDPYQSRMQDLGQGGDPDLKPGSPSTENVYHRFILKLAFLGFSLKAAQQNTLWALDLSPSGPFKRPGPLPQLPPLETVPHEFYSFVSI